MNSNWLLFTNDGVYISGDDCEVPWEATEWLKQTWYNRLFNWLKSMWKTA
jgi:hypothetical protein